MTGPTRGTRRPAPRRSKAGGSQVTGADARPDVAPSGTRRPAWLRALPVVAWVLFIWGMSLMPGDDSSAQSTWVVQHLAWLFRAVGVQDPTVMSFLVRKCAHFSEYAVLGGLTQWALTPRGTAWRPRWAWAAAAAVAGLMVPVADETIQLFVPGRSGQVSDMLLDMSGFATGALLTWLFRRRR